MRVQNYTTNEQEEQMRELYRQLISEEFDIEAIKERYRKVFGDNVYDLNHQIPEKRYYNNDHFESINTYNESQEEVCLLLLPAVEMLPDVWVTDGGYEDQITQQLKEIKFMMNIDSEYVLYIKGVQPISSLMPLIVTENYDCDIYDYIRTGRYRNSDFKRIATNLVTGLLFIHNQLDIVHGYINCHNIYLVDNVFKFGVMSHCYYVGHDTNKVRSPKFSTIYVHKSGEAFYKKPVKESDIYSLGLVFLYMWIKDIKEIRMHIHYSHSLSEDVKIPEFINSMISPFPENRISLGEVRNILLEV